MVGHFFRPTHRERRYFPILTASLRVTIVEPASSTLVARARGILPGLAFSTLVAVVAVAAAPLIGRIVPIPAMVVALLIGIGLNPLARRPLFRPGIGFCLKTILRWAVALLGLRVALGEIAALGLATALLVIVSMALTLGAGFLLARAFAANARPTERWRAPATAVCGASATLATVDRAARLQGQGGRRRLRGGRGQRALHARDGRSIR